MKKEQEKYRLNIEREGERLKRSRAQDVEGTGCRGTGYRGVYM